MRDRLHVARTVRSWWSNRGLSKWWHKLIPPDDYNPPLDSGIAEFVTTLREAGIDTYESCEGGHGHAYPEPTVAFHGDSSEGFRAIAVARASGLPIAQLRRTWRMIDGEPTGPTWEMTFARKA